jgi:hypothetical protein
LAAFNRGLCVITTRLAMADLAHHGADSVLRLDLDHLPSEAGASSLRTLGVGKEAFAAGVLGARGALLSVLAHFFENGKWGSPVERGAEGQRLTAEDRLFILMEAELHLTVTLRIIWPNFLRVIWHIGNHLSHGSQSFRVPL